jgi:uncharacterized membrane protein
MENTPNQQDPNAPRPGDVENRASYPPRETPWQRKPAFLDDPRYKSPALALFLSIVPGLGQVYLGYYRQGFINVVVVGTLISILAPGPRAHWPLTPLLVFFLVFYWLFNMVDALRRATFFNQAISGVAAAELPREFRMPEPHGSLAGGILLMLAGVVIGTKTVFGYSLEWLRQWWPLAPILVGAYLVIQALRERAR